MIKCLCVSASIERQQKSCSSCIVRSPQKHVVVSLGHPENKLFMEYATIFIGSNYPEKVMQLAFKEY